jgi:hypothetical protein
MSRKVVFFVLLTFSLLKAELTYGQDFIVNKNPDSLDFKYIIRSVKDLKFFKSESITVRLYEIPYIAVTETSKDEIWYDIMLVVKETVYPKITEGIFIVSQSNNPGFNAPSNYRWNQNDNSLTLNHLQNGESKNLTIIISGESVAIKK